MAKAIMTTTMQQLSELDNCV